MSVLLAVLADTHLPKGRRDLPARCVARLREADLILHAGDFCERSVLRRLERCAPVAAVHGNVDASDLRAVLPQTRVVEAVGVRIAIIHGAGPALGRLARMRRRFPAADAVVLATPIFHCTKQTMMAFRSSIRAARPSAAARSPTQWAWPVRRRAP